MQPLILVIHVLAAIAIISLVLLQHGKGADVGASFGSGSAQTMFGSAGSLPFLLKLTAILAAVFFATSLILGRIAALDQKQANGIQIQRSSITAPAPAGQSPQSSTTKSQK